MAWLPLIISSKSLKHEKRHKNKQNTGLFSILSSICILRIRYARDPRGRILHPSPHQRPTHRFFSVRGFASCTEKGRWVRFSFRLRRDAEGQGLWRGTLAPSRTVHGTGRSNRVSLPRGFQENAAVCLALRAAPFLRSIKFFSEKDLTFSHFCAIIKVRGNTGDGCYPSLVKITAECWEA